MIPIANVLVADPPWSFGDSLPGKTRGAARQYACMSTADICALRLPPIASDALLFLWRVSSMPQDALDVARAWGFTPKTEIVWVKLSRCGGTTSTPDRVPLHFGMGHYVRGAHETCIVASRGRGKDLIRSRSVRSVFLAPVGEHSAKPDAFYELVEQLAPGPYTELFGRRQRPGWAVLGEELGTTIEVGTPVAGRTT